MPNQSHTPNKPVASGISGAGATTTAHGDREALSNQVDAVIAELKELGYLSKEAVKHKAHAAKEHAAHWAEAGKEKALHYEEALERHVKEAPIKTLLIAAGVGALIGWMTSPRR